MHLEAAPSRQLCNSFGLRPGFREAPAAGIAAKDMPAKEYLHLFCTTTACCHSSRSAPAHAAQLLCSATGALWGTLCYRAAHAVLRPGGRHQAPGTRQVDATFQGRLDIRGGEETTGLCCAALNILRFALLSQRRGLCVYLHTAQCLRVVVRPHCAFIAVLDMCLEGMPAAGSAAARGSAAVVSVENQGFPACGAQHVLLVLVCAGLYHHE